MFIALQIVCQVRSESWICYLHSFQQTNSCLFFFSLYRFVSLSQLLKMFKFLASFIYVLSWCIAWCRLKLDREIVLLRRSGSIGWRYMLILLQANHKLAVVETNINGSFSIQVALSVKSCYGWKLCNEITLQVWNRELEVNHTQLTENTGLWYLQRYYF